MQSPAAIKLKALEACLAAAGIQQVFPVSGIQISQEHPILEPNLNLIILGAKESGNAFLASYFIKYNEGKWR